MWSAIKNTITRSAELVTTVIDTVEESSLELGDTVVRQASLVNATHAMNCIRELEALEFDKAAVESMDAFFVERREQRRARRSTK